MECPYCGSHNTIYSGVDDGFGDDGKEIKDIYQCENCGMDFAPTVHLYTTLADDEGYECVMCGKSMARQPGMRCPTCEQVWNS